jgi:uncharacterized membrane protein
MKKHSASRSISSPSTPRIPSERLLYLDFARGLAVFFMVMQHAMILHERTAGEGNTILGNLFILLGTAPAAPVFILIMGIFAARSRRSVVSGMKRGAVLIVVGYGLNLVRFTVPMLLAGGPYAAGKSPWELSLEVDIFQLTGLSLLVFSPMKKISAHPYALPVCILLILLVSPYLWGTGDWLPVLSPLWGAGANTMFPLFPWGCYFLLGLYVSPYIRKEPLEPRIRRGFLAAGLLLAAAGAASFPFFPAGDYSRSGLSVHLLIMAFVLVWLVLSGFAAAWLGRSHHAAVQAGLWVVYSWSRNVTAIYIVQWVIYGWSIFLFGANQLADYKAALLGLAVLTAAHLLVRYTGIKKTLPKL